MPASRTPEPVGWNEVKVLLEEIRGKDIALLAENMVDVKSELKAMNGRLTQLADDMAIIKPAVQRNTADIATMKEDVSELKKDVTELKSDMKDVKGELKTFDTRLASVESRFS